MRFSRTNMRLAAARLPDLSREIDAQAAEFSITHFCSRNPGLTKSTTYARETAKIGRSLLKSSMNFEYVSVQTCRCFLQPVKLRSDVFRGSMYAQEVREGIESHPRRGRHLNA